MKDLFKKMEGMDMCGKAAEVYLYASPRLEEIDKNLDGPEAVEKLHGFYGQISEIESLLNIAEDIVVNFSVREYEKIEDKLYNDYYAQIDLLKRHEILDEAGKQYQADYGRHAGQKFVLPDIREVFGINNRRIYWHYKKMEAAGLQPKLQLTPIGYKIDTLIKKTWPKGGGRSFGGFFSEGILRYEPNSIDLSPDGTRLDFKGGKSKNRWIEEHRGWLVELVPAEPFSVYDKSKRTLPQYLAKSAQDMSNKILKPMTVEGFLIQQLNQSSRGERADQTRDILLGAYIPKQPSLLWACVSAGRENVSLEIDDYIDSWPVIQSRGAADIALR